MITETNGKLKGKHMKSAEASETTDQQIITAQREKCRREMRHKPVHLERKADRDLSDRTVWTE